jgi:cytochrome P450
MSNAEPITGDIPSHIPPDLVVDVDFYNLTSKNEDVFAAWKRHQAGWRVQRPGGTPLVFTPHNGGHWIVTRGKDLEILYADATNLSNASISIPAHGSNRIVPGEADGEEHTAYRGAVMKAFTPDAVKKMQAPIQQIAATLVAEIQPRGSCNFMEDFGYRLPIILFLDMMKLPLEDGDMLLNHAHAVIRGSHEQQVASLQSMFAYLKGWIAQRRQTPGDDLISKMAEAKIAGCPITDDAMLSVCTNLLLGGLDTVASMLGFIMKFLAENDEIRERLARDQQQIEKSLNEIIRRFPIASLGRVVARDFTYEGIKLKEGDRVLLPTPLHGLDDEQFSCPMTLDLDRKVTTLLSFGRGKHQCLGSLVARVELTATLTEWLRHIPNFRIKPDSIVEISCGPINAVKTLSLEWDVAAC